MKDVLALPSVSLGELKRKHGKEWIISYIAVWLVNLNDHSQVKNKMNGAQIDFTAERICETYPLKITDLTLFFRNIKEGVYGPFYETLSGEKVMEWLRQYFDLRCEYAQMQSQSMHDGFSATKDKLHPKVIEEMFRGVGEEKVIHDQKGDGLGARYKNQLDTKMPFSK